MYTDSVPHIAAQISARGANITAAYKPSLLDDESAYFINRPAVERAVSGFIEDPYTPTALAVALLALPEGGLEELVQDALLVLEAHNWRHHGTAGRDGALTLRLLNYTLSSGANHLACINLLMQDAAGYIVTTISVQGTWPAR